MPLELPESSTKRTFDAFGVLAMKSGLRGGGLARYFVRRPGVILFPLVFLVFFAKLSAVADPLLCLTLRLTRCLTTYHLLPNTFPNMPDNA